MLTWLAFPALLPTLLATGTVPQRGRALTKGLFLLSHNDDHRRFSGERMALLLS